LRLRRAQTLVISYSHNQAVLFNFMTRRETPCTGLEFDLLMRAGDWQSPQYFQTLYPGVDPTLIASRLEQLTKEGFLIVEGTPGAQFDAEYESFWRWGCIAGLYHFAMKDPPFLTPDVAFARLEQHAAVTPPVQLCTTNESFQTVHKLPPPDLDNGLLGTMHRRRSVRMYLPEPISIESLRDCLFAGVGITGFLDTQLPEANRMLPLKMTPSGGARNPYEAYVYAQKVEGLAGGVYHYSALENSLGLVTSQPPVTATHLLAGQYWADHAAAIILLVANFERTMWKYQDATAYRVVLIEAGHIGQNIALAAASHDLTSTPTAALNDTAAAALLGLNWVRQSLVLAILLGKPHPEAMERQGFVPHKRD
jgi:SagB-type dehydrogenase family enzyme